MISEREWKRQRMQQDVAEFVKSGKRPLTNLAWRDYLDFAYAIKVKGDVADGLTYLDRDLPDWDDLVDEQ